MKRKLATLLLMLGLFAATAFQMSDYSSSYSGDSYLSVVKGKVSNTDFDRYWDFVTFGLEGLKANEYKIISVEVWDKGGMYIGLVGKVERTGLDENPSWYVADLNGLNLRKDFYLVVHVLPKSQLAVDRYDFRTMDMDPSDAPIDPDETVLIVKYP